MMRRLTVVWAMLACTSAADGAAQFASVPAPLLVADTGARVRISVASDVRQFPLGRRVHRFRGTIRALTPDTVHLALPGLPTAIAIPRGEVRRVEASLGPSSRWESAIRAGSIGAAIFILPTLLAHDEARARERMSRGEAVARGAAVGFAFGAWIGARRPYERWAPARLRDE